MGLDMYLYAEVSLSASNFSDNMVKKFPEYRRERQMYQQMIKDSPLEVLPTAEYGGANLTLSKCVGYWRKANAIHGWIVRNCADGVDECQRINLTHEQLTELRDECVKALANRSNATPSSSDGAYRLTDNGDNIPQAVSDIMALEARNATRLLDKVSDDPLAPTAGFFFGSYEKDDYYYAELTKTIELINSLLACAENSEYSISFYYEASW